MTTDNLKIKHNKATLGNDVISIENLLDEKLFYYDPGFMSTAAVKSAITYINGNKGQLLYRGYPVDKLAENYEYIDICYLLLNKKLPNKNEKNDFAKEIIKLNKVDNDTWTFLESLNPNSHPVGNLMAAISFAASKNHNKWSLKIDSERKQCMMSLISQMPVFVAACIRKSNNLQIIQPRNDLNYIENFLYMCFDNSNIDNSIIEAMDKILTLHADHEQNASTSTVRMAGSTSTPGYAAIVAGIAALWGPAHGGANEACLNMLKTIGTIENADKYINKAKDKNDPFRLMGFGHRVYKNYDPRAIIMQKICHKVLQQLNSDTPYFKLAKQLEYNALNDDYFINKKLYPNIDFYSGITLDAIGFDSKTFTAIFALGRAVGWAAHWLEMFNADDFKISRPRQWYNGPVEKLID